MPLRRLLLLSLISAACSAAPAFSAPAGKSGQPAVSTAASLFELIEQGRQALLAEDAASAAAVFDKVLHTPDFAEADPAVQLQVFTLAAIAASGVGDNLGAHEYMLLATEPAAAGSQQWILRALYAGHVDDWGDAGIAYTTAATRWPKDVVSVDPQQFAFAAARMNKDGRHATERLQLISALYDAKFKMPYGVEPANLWRDLALDALERHDLARARAVSDRITDSDTLVGMLADRRFDELTSSGKTAFDVRATAEREYQRLKRVSAENPRALAPRVQLTYSMLQTGRAKEIVALADEVLERVARASAGKPAYDDIDGKLNWIYDNKFRALRSLGHWDEALSVLENGTHSLEGAGPNVSQAINLGNYLLALGRPEQALRALEGVDWGKSLSPFGRMQLQYVRYRAFLQQHNADEAAKVLAYIREHHDDAEDTWQITLLDSGDFDAAAALFIARLNDPEERAAALSSAQKYAKRIGTPIDAAEEKRWDAFLARTDITTAIDKVGRRLEIPTYSTGF